VTYRDFIPPILTNLFTPRMEGGRWFYPFYSSKYDAFRDIDCLDAFNCVPEVNAVINMKANAFSNGRAKVVDDKGKEYPDEPILKLLKSPNWFQAQKEFMKQTKLFHEIYGNEYLYGFFGVGMSFEDAKALFTLPPNLVKSKYEEKTSFFLYPTAPEGVKYYLKKPEENKDIPIPNEQIIHLNDNRVTIKSANDKNMLNGESKLKSLTAPINNIKMAYQSRGVILRDRGANGAWVTKSKDGIGATLPLEPKEKNEFQDALRGYGTLDGQSQDIITNADLAWVQRGSNNPQNLGLFQECEESFNKILDSFGTPSEIFVRQKGATFENQRIAERGMYVRTVIPEANEWAMGLNARFYPDGKKKLILDYSHLEIFQDDLKKRADALTSMVTALSKAFADKAITIEEYKEELKKYGITSNAA
jgi:hypothetical protein